MNPTTVLQLMLLVALLALSLAFGWAAGRYAWAFVYNLPGQIRTRYYPAFRKRWLCPRGRHREQKKYKPKGEDRQSEWWEQRIRCKDCKRHLGQHEIHRGEVPEHVLRPPIAAMMFGFGPSSDDDDE